MRLNLIYARARNGVIGRNNTLPWHLPEDLAHFKATTLGCPVIMGRRTWDSLPPRFRPLPGRVNVVLTRDPHWQGTCVAQPQAQADQKSVNTPLHFASLENALSALQHHPEVWVIGGAQIYAQALPLADCVEVTEIGQDFAGDAYAPTLGPEWKEAAREHHTSASGLPFCFVRYLRAA